MKAVVEDISTVKKKIRVEVAQDDLDKAMSRAMADVAKTAKIPGVRPGKAPRAVVERHYGEEVRSDVVNKLITSSYFQAVREHSLSPVDKRVSSSA